MESHPLPTEAAHLWDFFQELHSARQSSGYGPQPLAYAELLAWGTLTHRALTPEEVDLIRAIDGAYLEHFAETHAPKKEGETAPPARSSEEDDDAADDEDEDDDDEV